MIDKTDYWRFLLEFWGKDELIVVEQDISVSVERINDLLICQQKLCSAPYRLKPPFPHWSVWKANSDIFPVDVVNYNEQVEGMKELPEYSDGSGLGLTKLCACIQVKIPLHEYDASTYGYGYIDSWISWYAQKINQSFHIHSPVDHNRNVDFSGRPLWRLNEHNEVVDNYEDPKLDAKGRPLTRNQRNEA
jgi:hypothetical protein